MKSSSTQYLKKQSGESIMGLQSRKSFKGDPAAKKREREYTDSKDAGQLRESGEDSQKQYLPEINENSAHIIKQDHQLKAKIDQLIRKNDNRPLKALWETLNDKATTGIELPMAIIMDPRCGIERRSERDDKLVDSEWCCLVDSTPLMLAVRLHRNDVAEALLVAGADPSACDINSWTAYLVAAFYGNATAMDLLVRYGADPFAVNAGGSLHVAAIGGHAQAIQVLVELGASTEAVDRDWRTPLSRAYRDVPSIVTLLDNGANLDAVADNGWTPLHWALLWGRISAIETLVWEGASITAKDKSGRTPLETFHQLSRNRYTDAEKARLITLLMFTEFSISKGKH